MGPRTLPQLRYWVVSAVRRLFQVHTPPSPFLRTVYLEPRKVVLVTASHAGRRNVWPVDWQMPVSMEPPMHLLSLTPDSFGTALIRESKEFVVNFMPAEMRDVMLKAGSMSGFSGDKFSALGLEAAPSQTIAVPHLSAALGHIECRVESCWTAGDHLLVLGRVLYAVPPSPAAEFCHETPLSDD